MKKFREHYDVVLQYRAYSCFDRDNLNSNVKSVLLKCDDQEDALEFARCAKNFLNVVSVGVIMVCDRG